MKKKYLDILNTSGITIDHINFRGVRDACFQIIEKTTSFKGS